MSAPPGTSAPRAALRRGRARRGPTKILVVLHQETSTPGRVGTMLTRRGYTLDIRRPRFGDPLPATLADHAGAMIFGGPMSANDDDDWVRREIDWIGVALKEEVPFLGICLGAQMLVRHAGGRVAPHPHGEWEIGYYPLEATGTGRRLVDWPKKVFHFHREGVELTSGFDLLATGAPAFPNQAFALGRKAFGVQFHPEVTLPIHRRWLVKGAHRLESPGARPKAEQLHDRTLHDAAVKLWLERFLDLWLKPATGARAEAAE